MKSLKLELRSLRKNRGHYFWNKQNNNINLKHITYGTIKELYIYIYHIQQQVQSSLHTDHNTGIITWYTFSIKLPNIMSYSLHCDTDAV